MSQTFEVKPITFPPQVLARISPDLSLQRHLSLGVRPCLRSFEEFKAVQINSGLSRYSQKTSSTQQKSTALGSSTIKSGNTIVFCTISGGFVEEFLPKDEIDENIKEYEKIYDQSGNSDSGDNNKDELENYRSVYPVVEIERGRAGPPTDEEMILSQSLYETLLNAKVLPKESLDIDLGLKTLDKDNNEVVVYPQKDLDIDLAGFKPSKKYSFVLYAYIQVFSRSGPLFDTVWLALISALKSTKLPFVYFDEQNTRLLNDLSSLSSKANAKNGSVSAKSSLQVVCDPVKNYDLRLNTADSFATTVGVINLNKDFKVSTQNIDDDEFDKMKIDHNELDEDKPIVLCDLEGDAEETAVTSRITVVASETTDDDNLVSVSVVGGNATITKDSLKKSIKLAKLKSAQLLQQLS